MLGREVEGLRGEQIWVPSLPAVTELPCFTFMTGC